MNQLSHGGTPIAASGSRVARAASMIAAVAGLAIANAAQGVQTFYDWIGPVNGGYNNAANWSPAGIPDVLGEVFFLNGGSASMTVGATVDRFDLEGGTLTIPNGISLVVATQIPTGTNLTGIGGGGIINLNSSGSTTSIRLTTGVAGDKFIWANTFPGVTSTINMNAGTSNSITGTVAGMVLVNQAVIRGGGQVGANVLNIQNSSGVPGTPAVIESNQIGSTLTIDPSTGGLMNDGVLRSSAGVLRLNGDTFTQTADGVVELVGTDANARVEFSGSTLVGGSLRQTAFGVANFIDLLALTELDSVDLFGARVRIPNANTAYMTNENVLDGASSIALNSTGSTTALQPSPISVSATLSGAGGITMSNATANLIRGSSAGQGFVNNLGGGIVGSGQIGGNTLVVTNNTFIEANGTAGLLIDPPAVGGFINPGTLRAAGASTLTISAGAVANAGGLITAPAAGSVVIGSAASIAGGTLSSANGGEFRMQALSALQDLTIATGSTVRVPNANTLSLVGTIVNNGTLSLDSVASTTGLSTLTGDVIINGTGQILSSNGANNVIDAATTGHRMTFNNTGGITGSGQLGANNLVITNNTTITSEGTTGLKIDPPAVNGFVNNGLIRSNAGSLLTILAGPFDNTNGTIQVLPGGASTLSNATISGGTLTGAATGVFTIAGTSVLTTLNIAPNAVVDIANSQQLNLSGTIDLDGTISLSSSSATTGLHAAGGDVIVNGDGQILMSNGVNNLIRASATGQRFTFNNAGGIRGSGQIGFESAAITNNTTITASGNAGLRIDPLTVGGFDNNGQIIAETGSSLTFATGPLENTNAFIRVQSASTATLQGVTITGGTLQGAAGGEFIATSAPVLSGVTLDPACFVRITNAQSMDFAGGLTNNGEIRVDAGAANTNLRVSGTQTLSGNGTITLGAATARFIAAVANQRLTIVGNTIHGTGQIGVDTLGITNQGQIIADTTGGFTIDPPAGAPFINSTGGLVRLSAANITINAGAFTNSGGTVQIDATRKLDRTSTDPYTQTAGVTIANGELEVDSNNFQLQGGILAGNGNTTNNGWVDSNVTNTGGVVSPGTTDASGVGTLTIEGAFTQSGNGETLIEIGGPVLNQYDRVVVTGAVTVGGLLRVRLLDGYEMAVGDTFDVITGLSRTGDFDSIAVENLPFALQFNVEMLSDRVRLVAAERCLGDYDLDGGITGNDIGAFFADFEAGAAAADLDQDGGITGGDIAEFFTRFENGC